MTAFAQKVAMWVGAIVIAIALEGLAFWIVGNIGRTPTPGGPSTPTTTTQSPTQTASTQPVDVQVTGTVVRTKPSKLEIIISEVVLESPSNITLCRTENILVSLRQTDPFPSENVRVRIKGEYNHQECSITLKSANHSISIIAGVIRSISLSATITEMNNDRTAIKANVRVEEGPEPCTRENLTVRLKEPLPPSISIQDKAQIKGNYNSATCEVRLDTPDTSISFPPVPIELRGTVRAVRSNTYILGDWKVESGPKTCQDATQGHELTLEVTPGKNADREVARGKKVLVKGEYHPLLCVVKVFGDDSRHLFKVEQPRDWPMTVEGVVSVFVAGEKMELVELKIISAEYPPCDTNKLTVALTDKTWADKTYKGKIKVEGRYDKDECILEPEVISPSDKDVTIVPVPMFISAGLVLSNQVTLYSAGVGIGVYDRLFLQGTFGMGSGIAKLKTGVAMSLNVTAFTLSVSYRALENFYLSAGVGGLLVRQSIVDWAATVFVPLVRVCLGYRMGIFMVEGGFYVSLSPIQ